jgi:hypothetical protein
LDGVAVEERRGAAFGLDGFDTGLAAFFVASEDGDFRAGFAEALSEGTAEGAGGSDDYRDFSRQIE